MSEFVGCSKNSAQKESQSIKYIDANEDRLINDVSDLSFQLEKHEQKGKLKPKQAEESNKCYNGNQ